MQRIDEDAVSFRDEESLLHVICALGAKYVIAEPARECLI
jgi:hypothetical protein